jgi:hypothetical protein
MSLWHDERSRGPRLSGLPLRCRPRAGDAPPNERLQLPRPDGIIARRLRSSRR